MTISHLRLILIPLLLTRFSALTALDDPADTTFQFLFELNMTKAIQDGIFDPDSGQVCVDFTGTMPDLPLMKGANRVYNGAILEGLDSGMTYQFRFRINDTVFESVAREATAVQGITVIDAWWNDDWLNTTTFRIDATHIPDTIFNALLDTLEIEGDMTGWDPVEMERAGTTLLYDFTCHLDPSILYDYIFRIKRDTVVRYENFGGLNRMFMPPDTVVTVIQYFDNRDTTRILLTLKCRMNIQQELGHFDPETDFLDVAGNFNGWGAWDILFDPYHTGTYELMKMMEDSLIGGQPVEFRFRINGSWSTAELDSLNPRSYVLKPIDTTGNPNTYICWYNNDGPDNPIPPWATDLFIQGKLEVKQVLSGSYLYHNINGIPEGNSLYKWYRADSAGADPVPIDSAWAINYTVDSLADLGKYLVFEVTPVASYGDSAVGQPVQVFTTGPIGGVGIGEPGTDGVRLYPNPASEWLVCEGTASISRVEVYSLEGILLYRPHITDVSRIPVDVTGLTPGLYLLRVYRVGTPPVHIKFVKN